LVTRFIDRSTATPAEQSIYHNLKYEPIAHINGGGLYDPRESSWYAGAVAAGGEIYWSSLYRFSSTGKLGLTAAKAVYRDDRSLGAVVGIDISLDNLSEFLAEQRETRNAVALIVDQHKNLVAFPFDLTLRDRAGNSDPAALYKVQDLNDAWLAAAYRQLYKKDGISNKEVLPKNQGLDHSYVLTQQGGARYITHPVNSQPNGATTGN
jgi:hypothetical protein